jgi:membrane carboxypeptidase/penicillin-binding protein
LAGGSTAAPIWADFMLRATAMPAYREVQDFDKPEGVDSIIIDSDTLQVATPSCPVTREEVYLAGSEPTQLCELHGGHGPATAAGSFLSHIFGGGSPKPVSNSPASGNGQPEMKDAQSSGSASADEAKETEKKKGPLQKIFGIFGSKKKKEPDKPASRDKGDSP